MRTVNDRLEDNLRAFLASLDRTLAGRPDPTSGMAALVTEAALDLVVLEHALRLRGLLSDGDIATALDDTQAALDRIDGAARPRRGAS